MYKTRNYVEVVNFCAELSMTRAIDDIKQLPGYSEHGEVCRVYKALYKNIIYLVGHNRCTTRLHK